LLVTGGFENVNASVSRLSSAELFDPIAGHSTETSGLNAPRFNHTATLLTNGSVLIAGGWGTNGVLANSGLYFPPSGARATNSQPTALQYAHISTLPPSEKAPRI
jgi:hypothetical protein